ncbi:hypothetical protein B0H66DRAFT_598205 [Apodospora peruviana]|uniref:Alkyl hydroperoxide reductase subunit C/ Thiol specific antioxidant domain-containing protein n=1 Tax=Apodospora peruviana TaxID=516989 RepID=A0AAE0MFK6_9PEZI|nr:hypothetical protein B0H66DRAFT_598205 [Apodospora peruviana]
MLSGIATKLALKKMGLPSDPLSFMSSSSEPEAKKQPKKLTKNGPPGSVPGLDYMDEKQQTNWPAWMSVKALPLAVQPWLTPTPPPIPVAEPPKVGDLAPIDRDRELTFGGGRIVLVVFLRCVGCAFAQKTFLQLRQLATKYPRELTCIAVSHSSPAATKKWLDLVGGAWNVQVVIDEDRAVYAAWGLGLGSVWYVFNPASQVAGFKEKGWLGASVATSLQRTGVWKPGAAAAAHEQLRKGSSNSSPMNSNASVMMSTGNGAGVVGSDTAGVEGGPTTLMGNKWQQAGAWAVDGRGKIVWGGKALRVDDVMDLQAGVQALGLA